MLEDLIGTVRPIAAQNGNATSGSSCRLTTGSVYGLHVPLLVNLQPAGDYLGEEYHRAGGVPCGGG